MADYDHFVALFGQILEEALVVVADRLHDADGSSFQGLLDLLEKTQKFFKAVVSVLAAHAVNELVVARRKDTEFAGVLGDIESSDWCDDQGSTSKT